MLLIIDYLKFKIEQIFNHYMHFHMYKYITLFIKDYMTLCSSKEKATY